MNWTLVKATATLLAAMYLGCAASENAVDTEAEEFPSEVVTQWNDSTELFLEYPLVVAGRATGNWAIHLTSMKDFQPIRTGTLAVRFVGADERDQTFEVDAPARDGIFLLDPVVTQPGTYRVELTLKSPQVTSQHALLEVRVFSSTDSLPPAEEGEDGGIPFLKEQQWQIAFGVERATVRDVSRTVSAPGEIVAPDGALVEVSAPIDGLAVAQPNRTAPSIGQAVRRGEVLAVLAPTPGGGIAQARGLMERLEREVERAERLYEAGAIAGKRLEEARHDLAIARAELAALSGEGSATYGLRITAPITGVVAQRSLVPGRRVSAGDRLFTLVDPQTVWLRAHVPASIAAAVASGALATFSVEGEDDRHETARFIATGRLLNPETRTVPALFEVAGPGTRFTVGQLAQVAVPVGEVVSGVAIPNSAIVDDNGTPVAYVQVSGETFERRILQLGASDGTVTHVLGGIRPGEMVVTTGAYQVRLASMSGNEFAGGHAH